MTVIKDYSRKSLKRDGNNCTYTIQARSNFNCSAGTTLAGNGDTQYCVSYYNVTSNGQTFSGVASSQKSATKVYRLDVPKNVTYVYAWVTSPDDYYLVAMISAGFASTSLYAADRYTNEWGSTLASNSSLYVYYVDYTEPLGDLPLFFSLNGYSSGSPYNISIYWEYCGATKSGIGKTNLNFTTTTTNYITPPCDDSVEFTNMNLASGQNYTFNVPAYNSSTTINGAAYGYLDVPYGTYGAINISCVSTGEHYIIYSKDQNCDCQGNYANYLSCSGSILQLLSQDIYSGGYWTFGACSEDSFPINVTVMMSGSVTVPSPSPVPSASASPGSSTGEDSSTGILTPAVILIVLAALTQF